MILYRARSLSSRPARLPAFEGNDPAIRVRGRWFTSVKADAIAHGAAKFPKGAWELVAVEIADSIVGSFQVAANPYTPCGLSPIDYAQNPQTEYVIQTFRVMDAVQIPMAGEERQRDYLFGQPQPTRSQILQRVAADRGLNVVDLKASLAEPADALGVPLDELTDLVAKAA